MLNLDILVDALDAVAVYLELVEVAYPQQDHAAETNFMYGSAKEVDGAATHALAMLRENPVLAARALCPYTR